MIKSQEHQKDQYPYSSIQSKIKLPKKRKLDPLHQRLFISRSPSSNIPVSIIEYQQSILDSLQQSLLIYDQTDYQFNFPKSKFPYVGQGAKNEITYEQRMEVEREDTFREKLNEDQIEQIKKKGEFQVNSRNQNVKIPYTWKINSHIFVGQENRINIWENGLAKIFKLMYSGTDIMTEQIPKQIKTIAYLPVKWFSLIFGCRKMRQIWSPDCRRQTYKDFWADIMQNYLKNEAQLLGVHLLNLAFLPYKSEYEQNLTKQQREKKKDQIEKYRNRVDKVNMYYSELRQIDSGFEKNWRKIRKRVLQKVSAEGENDQNCGDQPLSEQDILHVDNSGDQSTVILYMAINNHT